MHVLRHFSILIGSPTAALRFPSVLRSRLTRLHGALLGMFCMPLVNAGPLIQGLRRPFHPFECSLAGF
jgi:hypothetical protein